MTEPPGVQSPGRPRHRWVRTIFRLVVFLLAVGLVAGAGLWSWRTLTEEQVTTAAGCPTAPAVPRVLPSPRSVGLNVYNATGRPGLARTVAAALRQRGFVVYTIANDPRGASVPGVAVIRFGPKGATRAATLAQHVRGAALALEPRRKDAVVDFVLGDSFVALARPPKPAPRPAAKPAPRPVTKPGVTTAPRPAAKATRAPAARSSGC